MKIWNYERVRLKSLVKSKLEIDHVHDLPLEIVLDQVSQFEQFFLELLCSFFWQMFEKESEA